MSAEAETDLYRHLDDMSPWDDRLQMLEVIAVADEAPGVKTFTFRSDAQTWFRYRPGQFVTFELPGGDEPVYRTYTLSSSPSRPFSIAVTAKAQSNSIGTRWMFENLKPGVFVKAYGPAGTFSLHEHPAAKYLFVSAGSGVTPMMSMLRWLNDCAPWTDVAFLHCARTPEDVLFRKELDLTGHRMPQLSIDFLVEARSENEKSFGYKGRIDATRLALIVPDLQEREVFCCGPEPFMNTVREILAKHDFDMEHYHQESFAGGTAETPEAIQEELGMEMAGGEALSSVPIRFALSDMEGACLPDQTVLQSARAAGVRIPAACEFGLCGTCKVKKLSGKVDMNHNGGILDHEIEDGFILACCSHPLGPIEIDA